MEHFFSDINLFEILFCKICTCMYLHYCKFDFFINILGYRNYDVRFLSLNNSRYHYHIPL